MKKYFLLLSILSLAAVSCNKEAPASGEGDTPAGPALVRIDPIITKVTPNAFEQGDAIGVAIRRTKGVWAENAKLTYNGTLFSGEQKWYEQTDEASLAAYYPYSETFPTTFSVALDQSKGTASSDLLTAVKSGVLPTAAPVSMAFSRQMSTLVVNVTNNTDWEVTDMTLCGTVPTACLSETLKASVDEESVEADIVMYKVSDTQYQALVVPQTATLTLRYKLEGEAKSKDFESVELMAGKMKTLSLVIEEEGVFEEHLDENYFIYHGARYNVVTMKDGRIWMADNMRYVPKRFTPSADLNNVTAGVYYPVVVKTDQSGLEFSTDDAVILKQGYLYQAEAALGLRIGDLTTVEAAKQMKGAQGLCPEGWHVPTGEEIVALVGKSVDFEDKNDAPYYHNGNGRITLLNEDGFNMDAYGAVIVQDNTKTSGSFMGWSSTYPDKIYSGMFCGSSYATVSYNIKDDESSGIKNLLFYGFMPMTNKATEAEYTCNGTKVSYRIACPLRCIRDAE